MSDLQAGIERIKLAHELDTDATELAFLSPLTHEQLARLRTLVSHALFAPHEPRFARLGAFAKSVPPALAAKGAELALGPLISARTAAVCDPDTAAKLTGHMSAAFLARIATHLDPVKVSGIVTRLPEDTVVEVGRRLVEQHELIPLGRFVSVVPVKVALAVVADAAPLHLLEIALFTDDPAALAAVVQALPDERLTGVLQAAVQDGRVDEALTLLAMLPTGAQDRLRGLADRLDPDVRAPLENAAERHGLSL